jgi:hypothetical protein
VSTEEKQPLETIVLPSKRLARSHLLLGFLVLCLLLLGTKAIHHALQPRYQGKTVEEWFDGVTTGSSGREAVNNDPAVIGLRHLGTNAVWFLWREQARKESPMLSALQKHIDQFTGRNKNSPPELSRAYTAWVVLLVFGPETEVLIPEALELLKNGQPEEAAHAAMLLGRTRRQAEVVVPAILHSLAVTNRDANQRISHYVALKEFGPQAKAALPYLRAQLAKSTIPNSYEGYWLAKAILTINGPGPEVSYFTKRLVPGDLQRSFPNLAPLEQLGTNACTATPVLFQFAQTLTNQVDSNRVMEVIRKIDPEGVYAKP